MLRLGHVCGVRRIAGILRANFQIAQETSATASINHIPLRNILHDGNADWQRPQSLWRNFFLQSAASFSTAAASPLTNLREFRLAQTGEGIQECELVRWFVQEGDPIEEFGKVCEVHSDKATIEITSPYSGTIQKLRHPEGAIVPVGDVLAEIVIGSSEMATLDDDDGALTTENGSKTVLEECLGPATVAPTPDNSLPQRSHPSHSSDILTSPAVRKLALDHDVNLENVTATGPGGRISKGDVLAFLETQNNNEQQQHLAAIPPSPPPPVVSQTGTMASSQSVKGEAVVVPLRGYRKAMFKSMTAVASIPHFHYCDEICTDAVMDLRARLHNSAALKGAKLTFMPFFIKAAAMALAENPMINCSLAPTGDALLQHSSINIGVAVATPLGLVVPNIKNVEQLSIAAIAREMRRLQEAAMNNQLKLDDISGGTFTISNIGVVGGTYATPLINPPEVAIMALGRIQKLPRFDSDETTVQPAHMMSVSLGADHRVVDGATLAGFGVQWKTLVEDPGRWVLELS